MKKERDYSNLKETERLYDAIKRTNTLVKDYSMKHLVSVLWEDARKNRRTRLVEIKIGKQVWIGYGADILRAVNDMLEEGGTAFPRCQKIIKSQENLGKDMIIDTLFVSQECLQDHVAEVTIGDMTATIDMEELIKATRYA